MKALKYQTELNELDCDLSNFIEQAREAFRWVFEDIKDEKNFSPKYILDEDIEKDKCIGWGLSFFNTQKSAVQRLNKLTKNRAFLFKKLGTHIAQGNLDENDGISNKTERFGHFTLFEYKDVDLSNKFKIITQAQ